MHSEVNAVPLKQAKGGERMAAIAHSGSSMEVIAPALMTAVEPWCGHVLQAIFATSAWVLVMSFGKPNGDFTVTMENSVHAEIHELVWKHIKGRAGERQLLIMSERSACQLQASLW